MTNQIKRLIPVGLLLVSGLVVALGFSLAAQAAPLWLWTNGQAADVVQGQADFTGGLVNRGGAAAANTLSFPNAAVVDPTTGKLFVADSDNHRVLRYSSAAATVNGSAAEAVLGQPDFTSTAANQGGTVMTNTLNAPRGLFVDATGRLWVVDQDNNRVLRFDNAATKTNGANADGVLGQLDFTSATVSTTQNKLNSPRAVYGDAAGRLWVADRFNNRVLRFENAATKGNGDPADGVLGQLNFTSGAAATTQNGMSAPIGVYVDPAGRLWVFDRANNRVLRFDNAATKGNGDPADGVLGQPDFISNLANQGGAVDANTLSLGAFFNGGVTGDLAGRLYVADTQNHRLLIFNQAAGKANGAAADNVLGQTNFTSNASNGGGGPSASVLSTPAGLFFDPARNHLWSAEGNNRVLRYLLPDPEIQVLDGVTNIPDNTGTVNFGTTPVGQFVIRTFTVSNTGTADLTLSGLTVSTGSDFSLHSDFNQLTVFPNGSTTFQVRQNATAAGVFSATVQFTNNDPDETPYNFTVNGTVAVAGAAPPNDNRVNAIQATTLPFSMTAQTVNATLETNENVCGVESATTPGPDYISSVWYRYTPTQSGLLKVKSQPGAGVDVSVGIYTGTGHPLTQVACRDSSVSGAEEVTVSVTANTIYYIRIASETGNGTATVELSVGFATIYLPIVLKAPTTTVPVPAAWTAQTSGSAAALNDVNCPNTTTCVAVGSGGTILVTTNGGTSWGSKVSGTGNTLNGLTCPSTTQCVAVGESGTIVKTTDGGNSWSSKPSPTADALRGVHCPTTSACFAVGGNGKGAILVSTNGGDSWQFFQFGNTDLHRISCPNSGTCTAVGDAGRTYVTAGLGIKTQIDLANKTHLRDVSCPSDQICYIVGQNGTIQGTTNGGNSFAGQTSGLTTHLEGVTCPNTSTCFAVGDGGKIITSSNSGGSWANDPSNSTQNLKGVSCPSATTCFAVGDAGTILAKK